MKPDFLFSILTAGTLMLLLTVVIITFGFRETDLELPMENPVVNQTLLSLEKIDSTQYVQASADSVLIKKQNHN